jgi:hypothetical protein
MDFLRKQFSGMSTNEGTPQVEVLIDIEDIKNDEQQQRTLQEIGDLEIEHELENISKRMTEVEIDDIPDRHKRIKLDTEGDNGEFGFTSTGRACVDFFGNTNRDASTDVILSNFIDSWNEHPETALKILYNMRDARDGKGEKFISRLIFFYIKVHRPHLYDQILKDIPDLGSWKDLLYISELSHNYGKNTGRFPGLQAAPDTVISMDKEVTMFVDQLKNDRNSTEQISLCGKWAPGEGTHYNKNGVKFADKIMAAMSLRPKNYRQMLAQLRKRIKVVESDMSRRSYENINFEKIPSKCHMNHRKAFLRDTNTHGVKDDDREKLVERYKVYLDNLNRGKVEVKFKGVQPHEIVEKFLDCHRSLVPENSALLEGQWNAIVDNIRKSGSFKRSIAISDVSGSMSGKPLNVSIALGLLVAQCCEGPYHNKLVSFSSNPKIHDVGHCSSLNEKLRHIHKMDWQMNTNLEKVFDLLLDIASQNKLQAHEMVDKLFIFTDMQFDEFAIEESYSDRHGYNSMLKTKVKTFDKIRAKYEKANYDMPQIICWNLRTVGAIPFEHDDRGMALLSGFSPELLKCVMEDGDMTPGGMMTRVIGDYKVPISEETSVAVKLVNNFDMNRLNGAVASIQTSLKGTGRKNSRRKR